MSRPHMNLRKLFPPLASVVLGLGISGWYGYAERHGKLPESVILVFSTVLLAVGCGWLTVAAYQARQSLSQWRPIARFGLTPDLVAALIGGISVIAFAVTGTGYWLLLRNSDEPEAIGKVAANIEMTADVREFPRSHEEIERQRRIDPSRVTTEAAYVYRSVLINLSEQRMDWGSRVALELQGSTCIQIERFTPTKLRVIQAGSRQVKVDVFRIDRSLAGFAEVGGAWLTRENFDDYKRESPNTGDWNRTGFFVVTADTACVLDVEVLVDGRTVHQQRLRIDLDKEASELKLRSLF
jgi:hypothetical protein